MIRVYNILCDLFGNSKQGMYERSVTQYQFNCPNCAEYNGGVDYKYNLEVSFALGKFHCWSCGISGTLSKLIKLYGGKQIFNEYISIIHEVKESQYYDMSFFNDNTLLSDDSYIKLPKTFSKIDLSNCRDKQLVDYLNKRKITQDIIDFYNIGCTLWDGEEYAWRKRIIVPSYDEFGDLNYFIGRTYRNGDKRIKYKNCDFDKKNIVLHGGNINWDCDVYVVEGVFDSLYYYNTTALMGKVLTSDCELYSTIFNKANANVIVCLDGDTNIDETKQIYKLLNKGRLSNKIRYIRLGTNDLPWKDFGEIYEDCGKEGIMKAMKSADKFEEKDLI